jgi:hypothetical protein
MKVLHSNTLLSYIVRDVGCSRLVLTFSSAWHSMLMIGERNASGMAWRYLTMNLWALLGTQRSGEDLDGAVKEVAHRSRAIQHDQQKVSSGSC